MGTTATIAFLGLNASWSHTMLSGLTLRAWGRAHRPEQTWALVEGTLNSDEESLIDQVLSHRPSLLCATAYLFNQTALLMICRRVAALRPSLPIILGGPEFLGDNEGFLRAHSFITGVVRGDESSSHLLPLTR
ncbi:MAG: hypothetical protein ACYTGH_10395, partial [Planctomycetota bacterium]